MKKYLTTLATLFCCGLSTLSAEEAPKPIEQADVIRLSEALGHLIGRNLENPGVELELESIIKGMRDAANGVQPPMSDAEYEEMISHLHTNAFNDLASQNLAEADQFLDTNTSDEGIVEIVPGKLQYRTLNDGDGSEVTASTVPTIHYTGSYIDGTVFGSSVENGGPITLPLDETISGFSKGIIGMKKGEKRRLYIHPEMGYGTGGHLPPNSLLIFDVEVIDVNPTENSAVAEESSSAEQSGAI